MITSQLTRNSRKWRLVGFLGGAGRRLGGRVGRLERVVELSVLRLVLHQHLVLVGRRVHMFWEVVTFSLDVGGAFQQRGKRLKYCTTWGMIEKGEWNRIFETLFTLFCTQFLAHFYLYNRESSFKRNSVRNDLKRESGTLFFETLWFWCILTLF